MAGDSDPSTKDLMPMFSMKRPTERLCRKENDLAQILDGAADAVHRVDGNLVDAAFLHHLPHDPSLGSLEKRYHPGHLFLDEKIEAVRGALGLLGGKALVSGGDPIVAQDRHVRNCTKFLGRHEYTLIFSSKTPFPACFASATPLKIR